MNIQERAEALKNAREMHATDEANKLADLRGAHAGRAVLLYEVDALIAERDAWKTYAKALRSPIEADLGKATQGLRALGINPND